MIGINLLPISYSLYCCCFIFNNLAISACNNSFSSLSSFNPNQAIVKYHGFYSSTYEDTYKDDHNSTAKQNIDNWYEKNILNKKDANNNLYENYLEDGNFCIDRTLTSSDKTGVTLGVHSWYAPHTRHSANKPSFKCTRTEDVFNKKNNKLKYPISMLSLDEVLFAGGRHSSSNSAFYLYTGADYFTLSPSGLYSDWSRAAYVYRVQWNGGIFSDNC